MTTLRRVAAPAVLVALGLTGILGIATVLGTSSDDDRAVQILLSAFFTSIYGGVLLVAIPTETGSPVGLMARVAIVSGSVAIVIGMFVIWAAEPDDSWGRLSPFAATIAAGAVHLTLLDRSEQRRPTPTGLLPVAKVCVVLLTVAVAAAWLQLEYDATVQVISTLAILDVVASFSVLVLGDRDRATAETPGSQLSANTLTRIRLTAGTHGVSADELVNAALDRCDEAPPR